MATIITKNSSTASSVPTNLQLVQGELAVNVTDKRLFTENASGTVVELGTNPSSLTLPNGTANGVPYLNASKVLTSGSALTFDGTKVVNGDGAGSVAEFRTSTTNAAGAGGFLRGYRNASPTYYIGDAAPITGGSGNGFVAYVYGDNPAITYINGSEQMRLTSTGLGIGTSSFSAKLAVTSVTNSNAGQIGGTVVVRDSTAAVGVAGLAGVAFTSGPSTDFRIGKYWSGSGSSTFVIGNAASALGTDFVTLDSSGNLGLGVTPSAWSSQFKAIEIGTPKYASFGQRLNSTGDLFLGWNVYNDSTGTANASGFKYSNTGDSAALYQMTSGHRWYTAPSGTAGNAISFTQAMTLDASGKLLLNYTGGGLNNSNSIALQPVDGYAIFNHVNGTASASRYQYFGYNGVEIGSISQNGTTAISFNTTSDHRLKTNVRPANAARFMDIEFVDFEWVDGRHDCGTIAHQLASVYPDLVIGEKDATEIRTVEITPAVPAVLDEEGNEVTPAIPAVTEEQVFPVYQQVNYIGLIGRMGTRVQQLQRTVDAQAVLIQAMEARLSALEAK